MPSLRHPTAIFSLICCLVAATVPVASRAAVPAYVTRAEAAMILLNTANAVVPDRKNDGQYPDVVDGQWYVKYVLEAVRQDMINAEPTHGLLYPHRQVTKGEWLKMMTIALRLPTNIPHRYADIPPKAWYRPYVGIAYRHQLFRDEREPLKLHPNAFITHAEAAEALQAMIKAYPQLRSVRREEMSRSHSATPASAPSHNPFQQPPAPATENRPLTTSIVKEAMINLFRRTTFVGNRTKRDLLAAVNAERSRIGLHPLRENSGLTKAAQRHASDMWQRGYFSHFTPEGLSYVDRIRSAGYMDEDPRKCSCAQQLAAGPFLLNNANDANSPQITALMQRKCSCTPRFSVGENIAKGQLTVKQVVEEWMASPTHRRNILQSQFDEIGIGLHGSVWVQNFGRLQYN